jgi:hypothetical protein
MGCMIRTRTWFSVGDDRLLKRRMHACVFACATTLWLAGSSSSSETRARNVLRPCWACSEPSSADYLAVGCSIGTGWKKLGSEGARSQQTRSANGSIINKAD